MPSKTSPSAQNDDSPKQRPSIDMPGVDEAVERAVRHAIALHHFEGRDVPIMRNGKIVRLMPDGRELPLEEDSDSQA